MNSSLYIWKEPRGLTQEAAATLVSNWETAGADPSNAPFEPSDDVTWFFRELIRDYPDLDVITDATPIHGKLPVWLAGAVSDEPVPKAHVAVIRFPPQPGRHLAEEVFGLATKYDLIVFDPQSDRLYEPMAEMAEYASATFWPRGAIRAFVAGVLGLAVAVVGWLLPIPIINIVPMLVGGFLFAMAVFTLIVEGPKLLRR